MGIKVRIVKSNSAPSLVGEIRCSDEECLVCNEERETPRERKERFFPGITDLDRLSVGILEEEPVEVSDEELVKKARRLIKLEELIREKEQHLRQLEKRVKKLKSLPLDARLRFCSKIKDSVSGKLSKDIK